MTARLAPPRPTRRSVLRSLAITAAAPVVLGACSGGERTTDVLVAASLEDVVQAAIDRLQRTRPDLRAQLDAGASTTLATQVAEGRHVDLLATADAASMAVAARAGGLEAAERFATNEVVLVASADGPHGVEDLAGLEQAGVIVSLCDTSVPCGRYGDELLAALGRPALAERAVRETDVRAVVARLVAGEADVGVVYATDLRRAGHDLRRISTPGTAPVAAEVLLALATDASEDARALRALLLGPEGQALLGEFGFGAP